MSLGYADRLKNKRNLGGQLGAKEYHQSFAEILQGVKSLAKWISDSNRVFVFTGAGISTACGIPDFRGPNGIWTLRKKKMPITANLTPFEYAKPSFTHMAIAAMVAAGKVPYVCSQNVDSLHLWSGIPRGKLAELHGNCFVERCLQCNTEYTRDFQMDTVDFKPTGRMCSQPGCNAPLVDNILDWDTALPEDELEESVQQAEKAGVALVLGTSLQIHPANEIPTLTHDEGGKMVIVNLQKTPKDQKADLIIRSKVDLVMALLMQELGLQVPPYIRTERLVVVHDVSDFITIKAEAVDAVHTSGVGPPAAEGERVLTIHIRSHHGRGCPLPMIESLRISVAAERAKYQSDVTSSGSGTGESQAVVEEADSWTMSSDVLTCTSPASSRGDGGVFTHSFPGIPHRLQRVRCTLHVRLVKWADEDKRDVTLQHFINVQEPVLSSSQTIQATHRAGDGVTAAGDPGGVAPVTVSTTTSLTQLSYGGSIAHVHTFNSQDMRYDPTHVINAFLANPAPVVLPNQRKKHKAELPCAPVVLPTRASLRQAKAAASSYIRKPLVCDDAPSSEPTSSSAVDSSGGN